MECSGKKCSDIIKPRSRRRVLERSGIIESHREVNGVFWKEVP